MLAGGLAVWATAVETASIGLLRWVSLASTLLVAVAVVVGWAELLAAGVAGIVGLVAVAVLADPSPAALPAGLAAFALAELGFAAVARGRVGQAGQAAHVAAPREVAAPRMAFIAAVVVLSVLVGGVALLAAGDLGDDIADGTALALEGLGLAAIVGVTILLVALARRAQRIPPAS